jgi:hypothetical protein
MLAIKFSLSLLESRKMEQVLSGVVAISRGEEDVGKLVGG